MSDQKTFDPDSPMQMVLIGHTATFDMELSVREIKLVIRGLRRERKSLRQQLNHAAAHAHRVSRPSRLQRELVAADVLLGKFNQLRSWRFEDRVAAEGLNEADSEVAA
tara:strand:+ start:489 stop:812 length:324 start_codon:yes stop_codon:yes gene_type:complete